MKIKHIVITFLIFLILISATKSLPKKYGLLKFSYKLSDGEYLKLNPIINKSENEDLITDKSFPILNSAIIRSFETTSNNAIDFITYANLISKNRNLSYWSISPYTFYGKQFSNTRISDARYGFLNKNGIDWNKSNGFKNFYHKIFQSKTARTILFNQALNIVFNLCEEYPADFTKQILNELNNLLLFTDSLKTIDTSTDTDRLRNYWEGFIFRRYISDKVPILEIQTAIMDAQTKLKTINLSKQPDALYEININNQITFLYSSEKIIIHSNSNSKEILFTHSTYIKNIRYLKDMNGEYYQLNGNKNSIPFTYLYDKNLLKIE